MTRTPPTTAVAGLRLHDLATGYAGRPVFRALNLGPLTAGTLVAVVGPNAVGKSTLLKAIAGLRPATGTVALDGVDLGTLPWRERLRRVSYLPQALPQATSLVVYEAVWSALRAMRADLNEPQARTAVERVFAELGLAELALRPLDQLSGGQRQMVGLAQVLVREPRLLLLDEPTSALDLRWQLQVLEAVRAQADRRGAIALMAIHDLNLALRFADQVLVLGGDGVLAAGAPDDVLTADLLRRAYAVQARVERCSAGHLIVLADRALPVNAPIQEPMPPRAR